MQAELWTISGLAVELGKDRRTLERLLDGLPPDAEDSDRSGRVSRKWRMARVFDHLMGSGVGELDLNAERARLAKAQADKTEMEIAVRGGELLDKSKVIQEVSAIVGSCRARLIAIPDAVAQLFEPATARAVSAEVRRKLYEALAELTEYKPGLPAADSEGMGAAADADAEPVGGRGEASQQRKQRRARSVENGAS